VPQYRNDQNEPIWVKDALGNDIPFYANEVKDTYLILSDARITKLDDAPYYNPLLDASTVSLATSASSASYVTEISSRSIHLTPTEGTPRVFINAFENLPGIVLLDDMLLTNKGRISRLYFDNVGASHAIIDIKELE
jgi:hypothetical protein